MREQHFSKARISAVVYSRVVAALDVFKRKAGLKSRSAAVARALAEWAEEAGREGRVQRALSKYGKAYEASREWEERRARQMLALVHSRRRFS